MIGTRLIERLLPLLFAAFFVINGVFAGLALVDGDPVWAVINGFAMLGCISGFIFTARFEDSQ